jgi:hypothetical protein
MAEPRAHPATRLAVVSLAAAALVACTVPNPAFSPARDGAQEARDSRSGDARDSAPDRAPDDRPPDTLSAIPDGNPSASLDPAGTCPQRADLSLCLRFEGTVSDESQNRVPLTHQSVSFAAGNGTGMAADMGTSSLINVPDGPLFDQEAITIEAWIKPRSGGRRMGIVDNDSQYGMIALANGVMMCVGSGAGTPNAVSGGSLPVGVWTSFTCVFDNTMTALWMDGVKIASAPRSGPLHTASTYGVTVGSDGPDGNPFDGLIDNVRIWKVARSAAAICAGALNCH